MDHAKETTEEAFRKHAKTIRLYIRKYSDRDADLADDLFQETFLNYLKEMRKNGLKKPESSQYLLFRICKQTCISYKRKLATYERFFIRENGVVERAMELRNPTSMNLVSDAVVACLHNRRYPDRLKTSLRLYLFEDYPVSKIAPLFQVAIPTMYRCLAVGLKLLRLHLKERGIGVEE